MVRLRLKGQPAQRIAVFSSTSRLWHAPRPEAHRLVAPSREPLRRSCSTITAASCGLTPASWAARVRVAPRARAWVRRWRGPVAPALGALVLVLGPTASVPTLGATAPVALLAATATPSPGFWEPPTRPAGPTTPAATSSTPFARRRRGQPSATRADFTKSVARSGTPPPPRSRPSPAARPQR